MNVAVVNPDRVSNDGVTKNSYNDETRPSPPHLLISSDYDDSENIDDQRNPRDVRDEYRTRNPEIGCNSTLHCSETTTVQDNGPSEEYGERDHCLSRTSESSHALSRACSEFRLRV